MSEGAGALLHCMLYSVHTGPTRIRVPLHPVNWCCEIIVSAPFVRGFWHRRKWNNEGGRRQDGQRGACPDLLPAVLGYLLTLRITEWLKETKLERRLSSLDNVFVSWSWVLSLAVMLIEELQCPGRLKTLKKLKGKRLNKLQPLPQTLRLLGILQLDDNHRVSKAATSVLARAAANRNLREKVTAAVLTASLNRHWNTPGVALSCSLRFAS